MKYKTLHRLISPIVRMLWPSKIINIENAQIDDNAIYVCNHYTLMDTNPLYAKIFKEDMNVLAKAEVFEKKFSAKFLTSMGCIPVKRGEGDLKAMKEVMRRLKAGKSLLLYPEGTRNKEGSKELQPFKPGVGWLALNVKKPVIPILYYAPVRMFRKNYIIVGKPIYFDKLYDQNINTAKLVATQMVYDEMKKLRVDIDNLVEGKKVKVKSIKETK